MDVQTGKQLDLTPFKGVQAQIVGVSYRKPGSGARRRSTTAMPEWHDLYSIDVATGERTLVEENKSSYAGYLADLDLQPRVALKTLAEGGGEIFRRTDKGWEKLWSYGQEDSLTTHPVVIEADGKSVLLVSVGGPRQSRADARGSGHRQANRHRRERKGRRRQRMDRAAIADPAGIRCRISQYGAQALTPQAAKDIERLNAALGPQFDVASRTLDDRKWIVCVDDPVQVTSTYLYDRDTGKVTQAFRSAPGAHQGTILNRCGRVKSARVTALTLVSYLTLPPGSDGNDDGVPDNPVPMVLNVHGGPWGARRLRLRPGALSGSRTAAMPCSR